MSMAPSSTSTSDITRLYYELPNGDLLPRIGYGTWQLKGEDLVRAADVALMSGYRHFDTARAYENEAALGSSLKFWIDDKPERRKDLYITTKLPPSGMRPELVKEYFEASLKDLGLDYVDLYMMHTPFGFQHVPGDLHPKNEDGTMKLDLTTDIVAVWKEMIKLKETGRVRNVGVCNVNEKQLERLSEVEKPAVIQIEVNLHCQQKSMVEAAHRYGIPIVASCPLGSKFLARERAAKTGRPFPDLMQIPIILDLAQYKECVPAQILLRQLIQRGLAVIPKTTMPFHMKQMKASKQTGAGADDIYVSTLWYYEALSFLGSPAEPCRPPVDTLESSASSNDESKGVGPATLKKKKTHSLLAKQESLIDKANELFSSRDDTFDVLGKSIGDQLRDLEKRQLTISRKLISDVIYYGTLGLLNEDCSVDLGSSRLPSYRQQNAQSSSNLLLQSPHSTQSFHHESQNKLQSSFIESAHPVPLQCSEQLQLPQYQLQPPHPVPEPTPQPLTSPQHHLQFYNAIPLHSPQLRQQQQSPHTVPQPSPHPVPHPPPQPLTSPQHPPQFTFPISHHSPQPRQQLQSPYPIPQPSSHPVPQPPPHPVPQLPPQPLTSPQHPPQFTFPISHHSPQPRQQLQFPHPVPQPSSHLVPQPPPHPVPQPPPQPLTPPQHQLQFSYPITHHSPHPREQLQSPHPISQPSPQPTQSSQYQLQSSHPVSSVYPENFTILSDFMKEFIIFNNKNNT